MSAFLGDNEVLMPKSEKKRRKSKEDHQNTKDRHEKAKNSEMETGKSMHEIVREKKKKRKKHKKVEDERDEENMEIENEASKDQDENTVDEERRPLSPQRLFSKHSVTDSKMDDEIQLDDDTHQSWSKPDVEELLNQMRKQLPSNDHQKFSNALSKLQWDDLNVKGFTAEQCKEMWESLQTKVRKFRSLSELITDAGSIIDKALQPKPPSSVYMVFFKDKLPQLKAKHPGLTLMELTKKIGAKFKSLSEEKRKPYEDSHAEAIKAYEREVVQYKEENPDSTMPTPKSKNGKPKAPTRPVDLFVQHELAKTSEKLDKEKEKELKATLRNNYKTLSNKKKLKYINMALEHRQEYEEQVEKFRELDPTYKGVYILNKDEQNILDENQGKPAHPPRNAFQMFFSDIRDEFPDMELMEKNKRIAQKWKELSEQERTEYGKKLDKVRETFKLEMEAYIQTLPEEQRTTVLDECYSKGFIKREKVLKVKTPKKAKPSPSKPKSALMFFIEEHEDQFREENPGVQQSVLNKSMIKAYHKLHINDKMYYKNKELEMQDDSMLLAQATVGEAPPVPKPKPAFLALPKPPASGYVCFTKEMYPTVKDLPAKDRMSAIGAKWTALSTEEKAEYTAKKDKLLKKYNKDVEKLKSKQNEEHLGNGDHVIDEADDNLETQTKTNKHDSAKDTTPSKATSKHKTAPPEKDDSSSSSDSSSSDSDSSSSSEDGSSKPTKTKSSSKKKTMSPKQNGTKSKNIITKKKSSDSSSGSSGSSSDSDSEEEKPVKKTPTKRPAPAKKASSSSDSSDSESEPTKAAPVKKSPMKKSAPEKVSSSSSSDSESEEESQKKAVKSAGVRKSPVKKPAPSKSGSSSSGSDSSDDEKPPVKKSPVKAHKKLSASSSSDSDSDSENTAPAAKRKHTSSSSSDSSSSSSSSGGKKKKKARTQQKASPVTPKKSPKKSTLLNLKPLNIQHSSDSDSD